MKEKLCETCIYRNNVEQLKPCIVYRDDCEYYKKERGDMTREEAIHILDNLKPTNTKSSFDAYVVGKAITMAIKALEQELCEDTISRQMVLDYIYNDLGLGDEENGKDIERQMELESSYKYIKSLPPVTTEPCGDYVNRQAVLEYIEGSEAELGHSSENELVCQYIKELPPVKTEPKTGHWILKRTFPTKLYDEYLNEYKCSECYREIRCTESQLVNYPYCHCGARMESEG